MKEVRQSVRIVRDREGVAELTQKIAAYTLGYLKIS